MASVKLENVSVKTQETDRGFVGTVYRDNREIYAGMVYQSRDKARREALKDFHQLYSWGMVDTSTD